MTREEAIKRLEEAKEAWDRWVPNNGSPASKLSEAAGMAISALREQEERSKVVSNADRIRSMSDEELANLLTDYSNNGGWISEPGREVCYERIAEWLQQPYMEDA